MAPSRYDWKRPSKPTDQGNGTMPHEIVSFDEPKLQEYLGELVRKTVEDALNALLDAEADQIANAGRYERTDERQALCSVK